MTNFQSNGAALAAVMHGGGANQPGLVVMGSWTTVKEQMATGYARLFADAGYTAMTFDFRGFGESEGTLRDVESARSKAEDIRNAIAFLRTQPNVDRDRIGIVAVCASASYTALALQHATAAISGVKSVAMIAPWIHDRAIAEKLYGGADGISTRLKAASEAREHYVANGTVDYITAASNEDKSAAMYGEGNTLDYYLNPARGKIPQWSGRFATMAWTEWLDSDFVSLATGFALPLAICTGDKTATPAGAKQFAGKLSKKPTVHEHETATQFDYYDNPDVMKFAVEHVVEHFRGSMK